jgi:hypothetical protein
MKEVLDHPGALKYHKKILKKQRSKSENMKNETVKRNTVYGYLTPKQYLHINHPNSKILKKRGLSLRTSYAEGEDEEN